MNKQTNYEFEYLENSQNAIILTHGLTSSIQWKSLQTIKNYFKNKWLSTLSIDMYAHWNSIWNFEDFNLSKVFEQLKEWYDFLKSKNIDNIYIYAVSISALPAIKLWLNKSIKKVFLRAPAIEMYAKRCRELWLNKLNDWKRDWIIKVWKNYKTWWDLLLKYEFITDLLDNFNNLNLNSKDTKIFIWAWINDNEVLIDEIRSLSNQFENIDLWEFEQTHNFSDQAILDYIKKIDLVL